MNFSIKGIDHIQLAAPSGSEEIARDFFVHILGFKEIEKPQALQKNGGIWFTTSSCEVHIGIEVPFTPARKAHPGFSVSNLDKLKDHLQNNFIPFEIDNNIPNRDRIFIHDPFGNRIELLEAE